MTAVVAKQNEPDFSLFSEEKQTALFLLANGETNIAKVARLSGTSRQSIYNWQKSKLFSQALSYLKSPGICREDYSFLMGERARFVQKFANIATARISDAFDEKGEVINPADWPDELKDAVSYVKRDPRAIHDADGNYIKTEVGFTIRMKDDMKAANNMFIIRGYGPDDAPSGPKEAKVEEEPQLEDGQSYLE